MSAECNDIAEDSEDLETEKVGRPKTAIDWKLVDDMIIKGETEKLICERFDVDVSAFCRIIKREKGTNFTNYARSKRAEGFRLLRSQTFNRAMKGNDKCLMHLNKHMRGEWDKLLKEEETEEEKVANAQFIALMTQLKGLQPVRNIAESNISNEEKS